jgi:hypothetical protein
MVLSKEPLILANKERGLHFAEAPKCDDYPGRGRRGFRHRGIKRKKEKKTEQPKPNSGHHITFFLIVLLIGIP